MYHVNSRGWSEIQGVEVVVYVVVHDECGEVGILVYVENGDRVK